MRRIFFVMFLTAVLGFSTFAHADLIDRGADNLGYHLFYDTDLNITWYDFTNGITMVGGGYAWQRQMNWAAELSVTMPNGQSFTGWRLPTTPGTAVGFINEGELGHLFYVELGNNGQLGWVNTLPFSNLGHGWYWTKSENWSQVAWYWGDGYQSTDYKVHPAYGVAVLDGDVSPVPIPPTVWLLGSGLIGVGGLRKRLRK